MHNAPTIKSEKPKEEMMGKEEGSELGKTAEKQEEKLTKNPAEKKEDALVERELRTNACQTFDPDDCGSPCCITRR